MSYDDETYDERERLNDEARLLSDLRYLGAVDLERPRRTLGFEARRETADQRPRTGPAWGPAPDERW